MSIRLIARELYQLQREVAALEKAVPAAPCDRRVDLERKLDQARAKMRHMRKILDGRIDRQA